MSQPVARSTNSSAPFAKGSVIWRKYGPLPVWAWALILLGVLLAWSLWRRNQAAAEDTETVVSVDELPGDQTAPPIFIVPQLPAPNVGPINVNTVPAAPPGGGRVDPPTTPPTTPPPPNRKVARRYMIRPDGKRVWIDPLIHGWYSGKTQRLSYTRSEEAPRRYRLKPGGGRVWLDLLNRGGRYSGKTQSVK